MRSYLRLAVGCLALAVLAIAVACQVHADGLPTKGKVAAPTQTWQPSPYTPPIDSPPPEVIQTHQFYVGVVGGHAWTPGGEGNLNSGIWHGGIVGGWLYRPNSVLGMGVEGDYVVRDLGSAAGDGVASLRGRVGVFVGPTFVYGTAGVHETWGAGFMSDDLRRGLVVGGGIEREIAKHLSLRVEALHYRHADDYFRWGEDGSTAVRAGVVFKF
jgi:hypothetical protein